MIDIKEIMSGTDEDDADFMDSQEAPTPNKESTGKNPSDQNLELRIAPETSRYPGVVEALYLRPKPEKW